MYNGDVYKPQITGTSLFDPLHKNLGFVFFLKLKPCIKSEKATKFIYNLKTCCVMITVHPCKQTQNINNTKYKVIRK